MVVLTACSGNGGSGTTRQRIRAAAEELRGYGAQVARTLFDVIEHRRPPARPASTPVLVPRGRSGPPAP
ncbi:hypothetical protein OHV13_24620 [Kitasatospora purpeofusca]|uniref:hypothetical protein n=1 Tax=Kitasatospora purpeofusca TaxID=67352 RepID=UPI0032532A4B